MRRLIIIAAGVGVLALSGTIIAVHAGTPQPLGVAAGLSQATNNVAACSAIGGGGGPCNVSVHGDYFAAGGPGAPGGNAGLLGDGKYTGTLTINWATYGPNSGFGNENCAQVSGTMTFTLGSSVLKTKLTSGIPGASICEDPQSYNGFNRNGDYFEQVVSGTGKFKNIVPSSSTVEFMFSSFASLNASQTATGMYLDQVVFGNGTNLVVS
jgi:hypothetical protein